MTQTAMIWGASGGIGRALVETLKAQGWETIGVSRHPDDLHGIADHLLEADASDEYQVKQAVMEAARATGEINLWIYAAGDILSQKVGDSSLSAWQRIMDANLTGAFLTTHHSLPLLHEAAHLVYIGAFDERLRLPGLSAYAAAKAGLHAFLDALRKEERKRRVTLVRVGAVDTALWEKMPVRLPKNALTPAELAQKILTLHNEGQSGVVDIS